MKLTNLIMGPALVAALSACGGGGGDTAATYRQQVDSLITLTSRGDTLTQTTAAQLPDTGSADYSGVAFVTVEVDPTNENIDLSLIGDATVTANFASGSVTGSADNFRGAQIESDPTAPDVTDVSQIDFSSIDESDYAGTLNITGTINSTTAAFASNMSGTLTGAGNTVVVNADGDGGFGGSDFELLGIESDDTISVNGTARPGFSGVIAQKQ